MWIRTNSDGRPPTAGPSHDGPPRQGHAAIYTCLAVGLLAWGCQFGCSRWTQQPHPATGPLLRSPVATDDSVTLDIFFARFPPGDAELSGSAWDALDEQAIPVALRQRLAANGFRVALAAGNLPSSMAKLLQLHDRAPVSPTGLQPVDLKAKPTATQRLLQLRDGQPGYIAKSDVRDTIQVLWNRNGQLQGRTFNRAQCMFAVRAVRQKDGRVEVELVPELQYGEARQQYQGEQGVFRVQFARPKQVFTEMAIHADLSPGQMLVIGGRETRPGSIGQQFFSTVSDHGEEQKLLIVRLAHAAPADPLQTDAD